MRPNETQDVVVLGDLHMSAGFDPESGTFERHEDFRDDDVFVAFLEHLAERAKSEGRGWHLVILGDLLDFVTTPDARRAPGSRPDTSQATTLGTLDRIAAGHPAVFEALGAFAASDSRISIVAGNHDIELIRASTQDRFLELVSRFSGQRHAAARITFHPWMYHVPGLLYAEHGSQYHDLNAFRTLLSPYCRGDADEIDLPLGSRLSLYLVDLIESIEPRDQDVKPPLRYLRSAFKARPELLLRTVRTHAGFLKVLLRHAIGLRDGVPRNRRSAYEADVLRRYSDEIRLKYETVAALDRLAATSPFSVQLRALGELRRRVARREPLPPSPYLERAALTIHRLLLAHREAVPFYIFGHTHRAKDLCLLEDPDGPRYLNCGTWIVPPSLQDLGARARFTFVEVTADGEPAAPTARLLWWNPLERRPEPWTSASRAAGGRVAARGVREPTAEQAEKPSS